MRSLSMLIIGFLMLSPAFGQSDESIRAEVMKISAAHANNFNKQSAAGIAALYAQGATLVNASRVYKSVEENFNNAFKAGFNQQEVTVDQVSSIAPDIAIGNGEHKNSGQGPNGALQVQGRWTAVYVRENGVWKIRRLTAVPIPPPK
jgi:ketosteroid isomerase-like protein